MSEHPQTSRKNALLAALEERVSRIPPDFGKVRPEVHYYLFIPLILLQLGWVAYRGEMSLWLAPLLLAAGAAFWTFEEYVLHRYSFHAKSEHPLVKPFNSSLHLLHHNDPANLDYIAAPVITAPFIYGATLLLFRFVTGSWDHALVTGSGFIGMYLFYEFTHYTAHLRAPKTQWMRALKKHHMLHHFADKDTLFGVTTTFWDRVFGTYSVTVNRPPGQRRAGAAATARAAAARANPSGKAS